jgi:hypothetical protein
MADDVADRAVVNPLDRFDVLRLVAPLQTDRDHQVLLLGFFDGGQDAAHARGVGGDRLFHEDVLAFVDRVLELLRLEAGRRGDHDQVAFDIDRGFCNRPSR